MEILGVAADFLIPLRLHAWVLFAWRGAAKRLDLMPCSCPCHLLHYRCFCVLMLGLSLILLLLLLLEGLLLLLQDFLLQRCFLLFFAGMGLHLLYLVFIWCKTGQDAPWLDLLFLPWQLDGGYWLIVDRAVPLPNPLRIYLLVLTCLSRGRALCCKRLVLILEFIFASAIVPVYCFASFFFLISVMLFYFTFLLLFLSLA